MGGVLGERTWGKGRGAVCESKESARGNAERGEEPAAGGSGRLGEGLQRATVLV